MKFVSDLLCLLTFILSHLLVPTKIAYLFTTILEIELNPGAQLGNCVCTLSRLLQKLNE